MCEGKELDWNPTASVQSVATKRCLHRYSTQ